MHQLDGLHVVRFHALGGRLIGRANCIPDHQFPFHGSCNGLRFAEVEKGLAEDSHGLVERLEKKRRWIWKMNIGRKQERKCRGDVSGGIERQDVLAHCSSLLHSSLPFKSRKLAEKHTLPTKSTTWFQANCRESANCQQCVNWPSGGTRSKSRAISWRSVHSFCSSRALWGSLQHNKNHKKVFHYTSLCSSVLGTHFVCEKGSMVHETVVFLRRNGGRQITNTHPELRFQQPLLTPFHGLQG